MDKKLIKFAQIVTINESVLIGENFNVLMMATQKLLYCMKETNEAHNMHTEYFSLRLKDSEKNPFGKDLLLEWACIELTKTQKES